MARAGHEVRVFESSEGVGGGLRTVPFDGAEGLLDICSAVHPMAVSSRFFQAFQLADRVEFRYPEISFAHAMQGESAVAYRDLARTVEELGTDGAGWGRAMRPLVARIEDVRGMSGLSPRVHPSQVAGAVSLGLSAAVKFPMLRGRARALAAGATAHAGTTFESAAGRFVGAVLAAEAHVAGWPIPVGGSQSIADAMVDDLRRHGGEVITSHRVTSLDSVWGAGDVAILDTSPRQFANMAGDRLPSRYLHALRSYRYGNAVSKVDFVLNAPIPWSDERLRDAGTVHLGGTASQVSSAESLARRGIMPDDPFVLLSQPSRFDNSRLPAGSSKSVVWAYAHVPNGSRADGTEVVTRRIESFAPGFRDVVEHSEARPAAWYEAHNSNFVGGDVLGGQMDLRQFITRPNVSPHPWRTPIAGVYLCSAATPPGAGVHGMGGWHAARLALRDLTGQPMPGLSP
ncbi:NAD(P)/FAD-dependent oxidoreductase [Microbacterium sp. cx-55]|nr:NAD(P)/FAD-dependent oxidoreductase [Microbacterium sp. cx-55]